VLAAKGVPLDPEGTKDGRGREPTYRVSVHKNGQIVIGATYTLAMGLKPVMSLKLNWATNISLKTGG
jgi:hypothetical protein